MSWKDILKNENIKDKIKWLKDQPEQNKSTRAAIKRLEDKLEGEE
jgi:hypothetical protein